MKRIPSARYGMLFMAVLTASPLARAALDIADGVVVKFATGGEVIVRDGLRVEGDVVFTSIADDGQIGPAGSFPGVPVPGGWRGIRIERSSPSGMTTLNGLRVLFAGEGVPAVTLRRTAIPLGNVTISMSAGVGLRATAGTTSSLMGLILTANDVGFEAEAGSAPQIQDSFIHGNASWGARSVDPSAAIAMGNIWWGHPTGPLDDSDDRAAGGLYNPGGLGDRVTDGIAYAPASSGIPLIDIGISPAGGPLAGDPTVIFRLKGPTAVDVRLSENPAFPGVPFVPMAPLRSLTLSPGEGPKTVHAEFRSATGQRAAASTALVLDTSGPTLALVQPPAGAVLRRPAVLLASASDPAGVQRVDFLVDNAIIASDTTNSYSVEWDLRATPDGPHLISAVAHDNLGRTSRIDAPIVVSRIPPPSPVILSPASGIQTAATALPVSGSAEGGISVSLLRNGFQVAQTTAGAGGSWSFNSIVVDEGVNRLTAVAIDSVGASLPSAEVLVTVDTGPPEPPVNLTTELLGNGVHRFRWIISPSSDVSSYSLYRAQVPFASRSEAVRVVANIRGLTITNQPPMDGIYYYAVTATDGVGNEGEISNVVQIQADVTPPSAVISTIPAGTVGPGAVSVAVSVSETLSAIPLLTMRLADNSVRPIALAATGDPLVWVGQIAITSEMLSGPVTFAFSGIDHALNRGTAITGATSLVLDTAGPVGAVAVTPDRPLGPGSYPLSLTLDETAGATPMLRFLPPLGSPLAVLLTGGGTAWQGTLDISSEMGDGPGTFELEVSDVLGNVRREAPAGAPIVLDNTPPATPVGLLAVSRPEGAVALSWGAVDDAASYDLYRAPAGQPPSAPPVVAGLVAPGVEDVPPVDGTYGYAVAARDEAGNASPLSSAAEAASDRVPPGDPSGLTLALEGDAIRLSWVAASGDPGEGFAIYRSLDPITSVASLTPVAYVVATVSTVDWPTSDGQYYYAVEARDIAGNASAFVTSGPIFFDLAAPVISVQGVSDGLITRESVTIVYDATDFSLASVTATLDAVPFPSGGTITAPPDAEHVLVVRAEDTGGRTSTLALRFTLDTTPPSILIQGVADGQSYGAAVTPTVQVEDPRLDQVELTLNGTPFNSGTTIHQDGVHQLRVRATDLAQNVSDRFVTFSVDAAPPPVDFLEIDLLENGYPVLVWPARSEPDVIGYFVVRDGVRLTQQPIPGTTFEDRAFNSTAVHVYEVFAVDNPARTDLRGRRATLRPLLATVASYGSANLLTRRYFDTVRLRLQNPGPAALAIERLDLTLWDGSTAVSAASLGRTPVAGGATTERAAVLSAGAGTSAARRLEIACALESEEGSTVRIRRSATLAVREAALPIEILAEPIMTGGTARIRARIVNQGTAPLQIVTARPNAPTPDVEIRLLDLQGSVLGSAYLEDRGLGTVSTGAGSHAPIAPGSSYLTRQVLVPAPVDAPPQLRVEVFVRETHSSLLTPAADVLGPELRAFIVVGTTPPPYLAEAHPERTVYDQGETVLIQGRAYAPATNANVPDADVSVGISVRGFVRRIAARTDAAGNFSVTFSPLPTEAGAYATWAAHPTVTASFAQGAFDILGLAPRPRSFSLRMSQNSSFPVRIELKNTGERPLGGFTFAVTGGNGIGGTVDPAELPDPLPPGQTGAVVLQVVAAIDADPANSVQLRVQSAEGAVRLIDGSLALLPAQPVLQADPPFAQASVNVGAIATRNLRVRNVGVVPLEGVTIESPPDLGWITTSVGPALPPIAPGDYVDLPVLFLPGSGVAPGSYADTLTIRSGNHVPLMIPVIGTVTSSTRGSALFEVRNTENVRLSSARVLIQSVAVPALTYSVQTDSQGLAPFADLPTGAYQYQVEAPGTYPGAGTLEVHADLETPVSVLLHLDYVTLEWTVTPTAIPDVYEVILTSTFATDVPAPVLVADPAYMVIPIEAGQTLLRSYVLRNHGLVAVDDVEIVTPDTIDQGIQLATLVSTLPRLGAQQSVEIPFVVSATQGFPNPPLAGHESLGLGDDCQSFHTPQVQAAITNAGTFTCAAGIRVGAITLERNRIVTDDGWINRVRLFGNDRDCRTVEGWVLYWHGRFGGPGGGGGGTQIGWPSFGYYAGCGGGQ